MKGLIFALPFLFAAFTIVGYTLGVRFERANRPSRIWELNARYSMQEPMTLPGDAASLDVLLATAPPDIAIYRRKPIVVEARRWDGSYDSAQALLEWMGHPDRANGVYQEAWIPPQRDDIGPVEGTPARLFVYTAEGTIEVHVGGFIVQEPFPSPGREFSVITAEEIADALDLIDVIEEQKA